MIEVRALTKVYGPRTALAGVAFTVRAGERVMLVGPNGAGKTTLLRILATLSRPSGGSVMIDGHDPFREGAKVRPLIGFLSHASLLYEDLTARQNLSFYARMYAISDGTKRIDALLSTVGLDRRADELVRTFSRGMQQRLAVARAVLHHPRLLLLDEPYTGLDPAAAGRLTVLLDDLVDQGCTLLLSTHHPADEGRIAERVVILRSGRVIEDSPLTEDLSAFARRYKRLLGA